MKRSIFVSVLLAALWVACGPAIKVATDYDKQADFTKYKTYTFAPESFNMPVNDLNKRRILGEIESQLATKGLTKTESGDLLVDVRITAQERKEATSNTTGGGYGGGYRYGGYRYGGGFTTVTVQTYVDGTLIISLVDAGKKELVWQGTGVKTLNPEATPQQKEENIAMAVAAILKNYPPGIKK